VAFSGDELRYNWRQDEEYGYALDIKADSPGKPASSEKGTARFRAEQVQAKVEKPEEGDQAQGTGFFVNRNGYLLTCAHCVRGTSRLQVTLGEKKAEATVIAVDKKHDTALIKVDGSDWPAAAIADSDHAELGEEVRAVGFPLAFDLGKSIKITRGILSGFRGEGDDRMLLIDAAVNHGNSGGPLINDRGEVIGIVSAFLDIREGSNVGCAQPINFAKKMLQANSVSFESGSSSSKLEGAALTRRVVPSVAYIGMTLRAASDEWRKLTYQLDLQSSNGDQRSAAHRSGATVVDTSGGVHDEGSGDLMLGLLGSVGFEPLAADGDKNWQTQRVISFTRRTVEPSGPSPMQHFGPHGPGGRTHRRLHMPPQPGQGQNTKEETLLGAELARYEIVNDASGVVTVKKQTRFATQPAGSSKVPYLLGEGDGSFDFDTKSGSIRSYSFTVKLVVEGNAAANSTLSLTYQRMEGNTLASLPPLRPAPSLNAPPGAQPRGTPRSHGGSPPPGFGPSPPPQQPPVAAKPVEVPSPAARSQAEKLLDDLFEKDFAAADSAAKRIELARTLLKQAADQRPGTADHYVLLEKARDMAMVGGDIGLTCQLIDMLAAAYQINEVKVKAGALATLAETVTKTEGQRQIASMALVLLDRAIAADDLEGGRKLGKIAYAVARKTEDKALIAQTAERGKAFKEIQKSFEDFQRALATLKDDPKNAAASTLAGKYYCFVKDDWKQGLPLLAQGDDTALAGCAAKELAAPTEGTASFDLAETWDDLADKQQGVRNVRLKLHARTWYQKALPSLNGLARVKAEKALAASPPDAVVSTVSSYRATGGSGNATSDRQHLLEQIGPAIQSGDHEETREIGFTLNKTEFSVVPEQGALLIGFDISADDRKILALRPVFHTSKGQMLGRWCGTTKTKSKSTRVLAKAGYAVGALNVKGGVHVDGLSIVFMEIGPSGLNPGTSYESNWFGRGTAERLAVQVGGEGTAVIGIRGHSDDHAVTALGLVLGPKK
jgi:S1-C subfamily serine protease